MKLSVQDRIRMLNAVYDTLTRADYAPVYASLAAYAEGVAALGATLTALDERIRATQGNPGAGSAKERARQTLLNLAVEVIGAIKAYCAVTQNAELAAKVSYTASNVCCGKVNEIIGRCKNIWQAALDNAEVLVKYGINETKLTAFETAIKAFDKIKTAPRQHQAVKSAATSQVPVLVKAGVAIVRDQLDNLMPQFKDLQPGFYNAYFAARLVVRQGSRRLKPASVAEELPLKEAA